MVAFFVVYLYVSHRIRKYLMPIVLHYLRIIVNRFPYLAVFVFPFFVASNGHISFPVSRLEETASVLKSLAQKTDRTIEFYQHQLFRFL